MFSTVQGNVKPTAFGEPSPKTNLFGEPSSKPNIIFGEPSSKTNIVFGESSSKSSLFGEPSTKTCVFDGSATSTDSVKTENKSENKTTTTKTSLFGSPGAFADNFSSTSNGFSFGFPCTTDATTTTRTTSPAFGFGLRTTENGPRTITSTTTTNYPGFFPAKSSLFGWHASPFFKHSKRFNIFGETVVEDGNTLEKSGDIKQIGQLGLAMSSYLWKISDFSGICNTKEKMITSPTFTIGVKHQTKKCRLILYPSGTSALSKDYVSIFIECQYNYLMCGEAQISFSILDANLRVTNEMCSSDVMSSLDLVPKLGCSQYIKKSLLLDSDSQLLLNDTLTIVCRISLKAMDVRPSFPSQLKINKDLEKLFESGKFSDLVLEVEDKEFKVHKAILAGRSPIFHEMFDDASDEQSKVKLTDVKYEVMNQILRFIYTEKVNDLSQLANELLVAAHRFKLDDLKALCEESLFQNLNVTNVIDVHILAEKYDSECLKNKTTDFIIDNAPKVINSTGYKSLADSYPRLLDELFCEMVRRKISTSIEIPVMTL